MMAQDNPIMAQLVRRMIRWSDDGPNDQMMSQMSDNISDSQMMSQMVR